MSDICCEVPHTSMPSTMGTDWRTRNLNISSHSFYLNVSFHGLYIVQCTSLYTITKPKTYFVFVALQPLFYYFPLIRRSSHLKNKMSGIALREEFFINSFLLMALPLWCVDVFHSCFREVLLADGFVWRCENFELNACYTAGRNDRKIFGYPGKIRIRVRIILPTISKKGRNEQQIWSAGTEKCVCVYVCACGGEWNI